MTLTELLAEIADRPFPQTLDPRYDGGCPCWSVGLIVNGRRVHLEGRCWRVSALADSQELRVSGGLPEAELQQIGQALKASLDAQEWYLPYVVQVACRR